MARLAPGEYRYRSGMNAGKKLSKKSVAKLRRSSNRAAGGKGG